MSKGTKDRMYVYFAVSGSALDCAKVDALAGFKGTKFNRKGSQVGTTKLKHRRDRWEYRVDASSEFSLDRLITKIFKRFKDQSTLNKVSRVGTPEIVCVFHTGDRLPNLTIGNKNLRKMAESGISFWVDYYFLVPSKGRAEDSR